MSIYVRTTLWLLGMGVITAVNVAGLIDFDNLSNNDIARIVGAFLSTVAVQLVAILDVKNAQK